MVIVHLFIVKGERGIREYLRVHHFSVFVVVHGSKFTLLNVELTEVVRSRQKLIELTRKNLSEGSTNITPY